MTRLLRNAQVDIQGEENVRRLVGEVDSLKLRHVRELMVHFSDEFGTSCEVSFEHSSGHLIVLRMIKVRQLRLPEINMYPLTFGELLIDDVRTRGLEGITFAVDDVDASGFRCLCDGLEVLTRAVT